MIAVSIPLQWWSPLKQIVTLKYYHFNALEWTVSSPCQSQRFSFPSSQFFVQTSADSKDLLSFKEKELYKPCPSFSLQHLPCLATMFIHQSVFPASAHTRIKCVNQVMTQMVGKNEKWKKMKNTLLHTNHVTLHLLTWPTLWDCCNH